MAAAKPDAAHPPAAGAAAAAAAAAATAAAPAADAAGKAASKGIAAFIPLIGAVVLAPALSFAVGQFVLLPQLKKQLAAPIDAKAMQAASAAAEAPAPEAAEGGKEGKGKKEGPVTNTYEFSNVIVNLSGTMGTRYLKTTFMVTGSEKNLHGAFEGNKAKLLDVTLNVLSALSLTDLEEAGAKNLIREKLIAAYNQSLGKKIAEQVYFSDFVVQ